MTTRNDIFIGLVIFYSILVGLLGVWDVDGISYDSGSDLSFNSSYTLNESRETLILCEIINPIIGTLRIDCENGKSFNLEQVEITDNDDLIVYSDLGFIGWLSTTSDFGESVAGFFSTMTTNISGLPPIFNIVLFTPLGIMVIWLLVDLIIYITPFIGGGS